MFTQIEYARMLITLIHARADRARREGFNEIGASAIEWAIISAVVVTLALGIYTVINNVVQQRQGEIEQGVNGG